MIAVPADDVALLLDQTVALRNFIEDLSVKDATVFRAAMADLGCETRPSELLRLEEMLKGAEEVPFTEDL
jgi:hypothetical protein